MQEISIKNDLDLKICINGIPDLKLISKDIKDSFLSALELQITDFVYKKRNCEDMISKKEI